MSGLVGAYIFGSALTADAPNDIDLCIVTDAKVGSDKWRQIRTQRDSITQEFLRVFDIPLSVMLVTCDEWHEVDGVIVRERCSLTD